MQEDEVCDVKWATYDEIEELFNSNQFIKNRWEYVREIIKANILDFKEIEDIIK